MCNFWLPNHNIPPASQLQSLLHALPHPARKTAAPVRHIVGNPVIYARHFSPVFPARAEEGL